MPHADDRFSGHVENGDPRSLLTGAFGCVWPTVPAYRYAIQSSDATGLWRPFNDGGAILELSSGIWIHDFPTWELLGIQPPFEFVRWYKLPADNELGGYTWQLWWKRLDDPLNILDQLAMPFGRCNENVKLPDWNAGPSFPGSFGATARAEQVVFDQTEPPA